MPNFRFMTRLTVKTTLSYDIHTLRDYMEHYHGERNHQGLDNQLIIPRPARCSKVQRIDCRSRLGGMLRFYERAAA